MISYEINLFKFVGQQSLSIELATLMASGWALCLNTGTFTSFELIRKIVKEIIIDKLFSEFFN